MRRWSFDKREAILNIEEVGAISSIGSSDASAEIKIHWEYDAGVSDFIIMGSVIKGTNVENIFSNQTADNVLSEIFNTGL